MIDIRNRWTNELILSIDAENLYGADLRGASLYGANLYGANLRGANLRDVNLYGADLSGASLSGASLSGANLSGANLYCADLSGAKIDGEEITITPITITGLYWWVLITDSYMRIGCQRHTHAEWQSFEADEIADMAEGASDFWAQNKKFLLAACSAHAKKATGVDK